MLLSLVAVAAAERIMVVAVVLGVI